MTEHSGGSVPVHSVKSCVVYDEVSGEIHHVHHVVTLEGGRESTDAEIEAFAISRARVHIPDSKGVRALHVAADALQPGELYAVDPKNRGLVKKGKAPAHRPK